MHSTESDMLVFKKVSFKHLELPLLERLACLERSSSYTEDLKSIGCNKIDDNCGLWKHPCTIPGKIKRMDSINTSDLWIRIWMLNLIHKCQ